MAIEDKSSIIYSFKRSFDTLYNFVSHGTFGIPDAVWIGSKDRSDKKWNFTSDFFNHLTAGITGTVDLDGTGAYSLPGMSSQASPLHDAGISGTTMYGSSAAITSGGKSVAGQVTSTSAKQVEKPKKKKKKNKVFGFLKDAADFLILDDVKTVFDSKASLWDKGVAIFSVTPTGKALKAGRLGFKLVQKSPFGKVVSKKVDQVTSKGNPGRSGKQGRLKEIAKDDKISSALRGAIKRDINEIKLGKRRNIRVPQGYNLAHRRGYEARKGYGYEYSDLQTIKSHRTHINMMATVKD